jgi:hypothetical protein
MTTPSRLLKVGECYFDYKVGKLFTFCDTPSCRAVTKIHTQFKLLAGSLVLTTDQTSCQLICQFTLIPTLIRLLMMVTYS